MLSALSHPQLSNCRRIFLRNYALDVNIGIHDFERRGAQRVVINVDLFVDLAQTTPHQDKIFEVVDYDFIRQSIRGRIGQGHINLQETLCDDIARTLLAHPAVRAVRVSTEKPDVYPESEGVGVEVFHVKSI